MRNNKLRLASMVSFGAVLGLATAAANAIVITGTIENNDNNYSLIHAGSNPTGSDARDQWLRFDDGETFVFDLTDNMITTSGSQFYTLTSNIGDMAALEIVSLVADLDGSNGFAGGQLDYVLDGQAGSFVFLDKLYGTSLFNSSAIVDGLFQAYMWGGDVGNDLGLDFSFSGRVPEPGTLLLFGAGLVAVGFARKRL